MRISAGSGAVKRPMRTATGDRPVMNATREGTHCGAAQNILENLALSAAKRSRLGVWITGLPEEPRNS